ncbi:MAG: 1-deoxy-D-xylulose-5-phosphate synthase [Geobacteraceae bacterium]|nr:1-deoxy-D-xylulose-5-phosphate synthase [Geobacteraceae bacterium]
MTTILDKINDPADLKKLSVKDLETLSAELRTFLLENISKTGGHLASNLGAVELTLALHYCFNSPKDRFIWDVGHQAYTHKIITGRRDLFHTQRQKDGLSGFPKRCESEHDAFGTGHSSTSISAGLGMAVASGLRGDNNRVVAVIGDGSLTGGMAFEALNQAGHLKQNLIVVLNDNEMSISENVGAFSTFISRKMTSSSYRELRKEMAGLLSSIPAFGRNILQFARRAEHSLKGFLTPAALFEALGFEYLGPIPGHDLEQMIEIFSNLKNVEGPVLVHVATKKGCGYQPAENEPGRFHGVGRFDLQTGKAPASAAAPISFTAAFGDAMVQLAEEDKKIVAITAAMPEGTGLTPFSKAFPDRFFDVGIAEQHALTFASGLALEGFKPVAAIYSTFAQRAYDQLFHDICLQKSPVTLAMDRAGLVGDDGPTHHGAFDISFTRHLPQLTVMAPKDENELRRMLKTAVNAASPISLRYPRGAGFGVTLDRDIKELEIGVGEQLSSGSDLAIIAIGSSVYPALEAAALLENAGIMATVVNARFVKPLDKNLILSVAKECGAIVTVEENALQGGFGSAVLELLADERLTGLKVKRIGIPDRFIEHGTQAELRQMLGLDAEGIARRIRDFLGK